MRLRTSSGYTYLALLFAIAAMGLAMAAAGTSWKIIAQHEREAQLLYVGGEIRSAIEHYVLRSTSGAHGFPKTLHELVEDERGVKPEHWLRHLYQDPMTGSSDWQLIEAPDGGIMGVASKSQGVPLKRAKFAWKDRKFKDAECYCEWKFVYDPRRRPRHAMHF